MASYRFIVLDGLYFYVSIIVMSSFIGEGGMGYEI